MNKDAAVASPNYFCTWSTQNYMYGCGTDAFDLTELEGSVGAQHARDSMKEEAVFGPGGWAATFYPGIRSSLYFLLDDGWDVPTGGDKRFFGSLIVDEDRFPSCTGTPRERLAALNDMARRAGWRGIGLWVAAQEAPYYFDAAQENFAQRQEAYWKERLLWSCRAGVEYWKVDWGKHAGAEGFRERLTQWGREIAPDLVIEHARCQPCVNDEIPQSMGGRAKDEPLRIYTGKVGDALVAEQKALLAFSDVLRSYDVFPHLSQVQTIERVARLLEACQGQTAAGRGLINCEDELYIAAALGLSAGVMRFPLRGLRPGQDVDCSFPASGRNVKKRMDEVARLVNFQRIMPAFGVDEASVEVDPERLRDAWRFEKGQTWMSTAIGQVVEQSAPACVARGMKLPSVCVAGDAPFVLAARHPNGVAAVATLARTQVGRSYFTPLAQVAVDLEAPVSCLGVFGRFEGLTVRGTEKARRILARDLCGGEDEDITDGVIRREDGIAIPGSLLARIGLGHATPGDESDPGALVTFREG